MQKHKWWAVMGSDRASRTHDKRRLRPSQARPWFQRPEIYFPALVSLLAVALTASLNFVVGMRLEQRKFQFEVQKFAIQQGRDEAEQIKLLCRFADLGMIKDENRRYHRAAIGGVRVCQDETFSPQTAGEAYRGLRDQIGQENLSRDPLNLEWGLLKSAGALANVRLEHDGALKPGPIGEISLHTLVTPELLGIAGRAGVDANVHFIIQRNGTVTQTRDILDRDSSDRVTIGVVNPGALSEKPDPVSGQQHWLDPYGTAVSSGAIVRLPGEQGSALQMLSRAQGATLIRLLRTLCAETIGSKEVTRDNTTVQLLFLSRLALPTQCSPTH